MTLGGFHQLPPDFVVACGLHPSQHCLGLLACASSWGCHDSRRQRMEATLHHAPGGPSASAGPDICLVVCWDEEDGEIEVGAVIILYMDGIALRLLHGLPHLSPQMA